jgi:hypothetical protein
MAKLTTLEPSADPKTLLEVLDRDGAAILAGPIPQSVVSAMNEELEPYVQRTGRGRDDFSGRETQRTGALVARTKTCRDLVMHPQVLGLARSFLEPWCSRIVLHLTQSIRLLPGQGRQLLHRDRLAWGGYIPRTIEPQFNTLWALSDFTAENGATRVVPGSHRWPDEQRATPDQITQAEMSQGSVLLYTGSVIHGGGENRSQTPRTGLNITYCLGWLRQEENQYLSCPPHIAKDLDPELQELLGYTQGQYALGYYSDPEGPGEQSDIRPPENALGRAPRKGQTLSITGE